MPFIKNGVTNVQNTECFDKMLVLRNDVHEKKKNGPATKNHLSLKNYLCLPLIYFSCALTLPVISANAAPSPSPLTNYTYSLASGFNPVVGINSAANGSDIVHGYHVIPTESDLMNRFNVPKEFITPDTKWELNLMTQEYEIERHKITYTGKFRQLVKTFTDYLYSTIFSGNYLNETKNAALEKADHVIEHVNSVIKNRNSAFEKDKAYDPSNEKIKLLYNNLTMLREKTKNTPVSGNITKHKKDMEVNIHHINSMIDESEKESIAYSDKIATTTPKIPVEDTQTEQITTETSNISTSTSECSQQIALQQDTCSQKIDLQQDTCLQEIALQRNECLGEIISFSETYLNFIISQENRILKFLFHQGKTVYCKLHHKGSGVIKYFPIVLKVNINKLPHDISVCTDKNIFNGINVDFLELDASATMCIKSGKETKDYFSQGGENGWKFKNFKHFKYLKQPFRPDEIYFCELFDNPLDLDKSHIQTKIFIKGAAILKAQNGNSWPVCENEGQIYLGLEQKMEKPISVQDSQIQPSIYAVKTSRSHPPSAEQCAPDSELGGESLMDITEPGHVGFCVYPDIYNEAIPIIVKFIVHADQSLKKETSCLTSTSYKNIEERWEFDLPPQLSGATANIEFTFCLTNTEAASLGYHIESVDSYKVLYQNLDLPTKDQPDGINSDYRAYGTICFLLNGEKENAKRAFILSDGREYTKDYPASKPGNEKEKCSEDKSIFRINEIPYQQQRRNDRLREKLPLASAGHSAVYLEDDDAAHSPACEDVEF